MLMAAGVFCSKLFVLSLYERSFPMRLELAAACIADCPIKSIIGYSSRLTNDVAKPLPSRVAMSSFFLSRMFYRVAVSFLALILIDFLSIDSVDLFALTIPAAGEFCFDRVTPESMTELF